MEGAVQRARSKPGGTLNRASPEPLYRQLAGRLESAIHDGTLRPGDRIESEAALIARYRVSRITLRQAVDDLVRKQLLVRKQGKGTFVTAPPVRHDLSRRHGLLASLFAQADNASARLVRYGLVTPTADVASAMQLKNGEPALAVDRLYMIGGKPVALALGWLIEAAAGIPRAKAELIATEDMLREAGLAIASSHVTLRAQAAGETIGKMLRVSPRTPLLLLERRTTGPDGTVNEFGRIYFCSDSYEIVISHHDAKLFGIQPTRAHAEATCQPRETR
jgi:GntR family transcriptional regulator